MTNDHDPLLEPLSRLEPMDVDALASERIRRAGRQAMQREHARPRLRALSRLWNDTLEPVFTVAVVCSQLLWMVHVVHTVHRAQGSPEAAPEASRMQPSDPLARR